MSYTQLRAFHAVASTGSFTKAAEALRVTQPTVSGQVKELEEMYGLALFDRHWRSIALTDAGRRLFELTRQMFAVEEAVQELLEQGRELRAGHLRVGADGPHHAVPLIAEFERRHEGLSVSLSIGNADQVLHDVLDYNVDVAVVAEVRRDERLYHFTLRRDPLVVFVPIDHPWAKLAEVELKDVATQRLVVREQGSVTRQIVEAGMAKLGIANGPRLEVQGREAMREFVAAGLGIGVVSAGEFSRDDRLVALPLKDRPLEMTEYVVCLEERRKVRIVRAFLEIARSLRTA